MYVVQTPPKTHSKTCCKRSIYIRLLTCFCQELVVLLVELKIYIYVLYEFQGRNYSPNGVPY